VKFSEQWLREWVAPDVSTAELAEQLTTAGLEVDAVTDAAPAFEGVIVAKVLTVAPHPDAERLTVCEVDVGQGQPVQVVCGAPNVRPGLCAPLAMVGAYLPDGNRVVRAKLRGVASEGMLCSAAELGLSDDAEGLMELPEHAPAGHDLRDYLGLDDQVIELDLTPNRGDCLGVAGIAREVGVLSRCDVRAVKAEPVSAAISDTFPVQVDAPADCPRYVGRVLRGIDRDARTPLWMRERLRRSGINSISPVVDVTNYVLLELGQPMHAFDLGKLTAGICVRHARDGETLTLLDGKEITLAAGTLVIADQDEVLAMAGIMGGLNSGVTANTADLFLESAFFSPDTIAGRARCYGLHTDSSHRFERGVDPDLQRRAMERATALLVDIVGGEPGPTIEVVAQEHLPARPTIALRKARLAALIGVEVAGEEVRDGLERLGMQLSDTDAGWDVIPPGFRFDIGLEADLIEEVARIYGYSRIPSRKPVGRLAMAPRPEATVTLGRVRRLLSDRGYQEAITYSFVDPALQRRLNPDAEPVALANPLSADMADMRTTLWPGLVQALIYNQNRQQGRVRLFECGLKFTGKLGEVRQQESIAGIMSGSAVPEQWDEPERLVDFYDLKSDVEAILGLTGRSGEFIFSPEKHPALHPGQSAAVYQGGRTVGRLGVIHPELGQYLELVGSVLLFELEFAAIGQGVASKLRELSKFPTIRRDLAIVLDEAVAGQAVLDCIREAGGEILQEVVLFDVYRGKGIDSGRKSLALGLTLGDFSRTLTDRDVEAAIQQMVAALHKNIGATLRE